MPRIIRCPNPFSKRNCRARYLFLKSHLHALMVHLRAHGHRATIVKRDPFLFLGVLDESGSLHLCSNHADSGRQSRTSKKRLKPPFPLFTLWQEQRLVLLKQRPKRQRTLASRR